MTHSPILRRLAQGLATLAAVSAIAASAVAAPHDVKIINATGHSLLRFYASSTTTSEWGADLLGAGLVAPGTEVSIRINDSAGACKFDFRAVLDDGRTVERHNINVCETDTYRLEP